MSWFFIIKIMYNLIQKEISGPVESKNLIHEFFVFSGRLFKFSILDWREYLENDVIWQWVHSPMFTSRKTSQIWLVHFFIFKKSIGYFFVLKNFGVFGTFLLVVAFGQVCKRIVWYWCTFARKLYDCACALVLSELFFIVYTFTCVVDFLFWLVIAKSVMQFFALLYFGIFQTVFICVLRIFLYIFLLDCLHFDIAYAFTCSSYFFPSFCASFACFFCQVSHIYIVWLFCRFWRCCFRDAND